MNALQLLLGELLETLDIVLLLCTALPSQPTNQNTVLFDQANDREETRIRYT